MARPPRDAIQAYMSITGASESLAIQRLEEHGGNLAEAVNTHFRELERNIVNPTSGAYPDYNIMEDNRHVQDRDSRQGGLPSLFAAARAFRPSLLLDPDYRRNILRQIGIPAFSGRPPPASHTGEVTGFPAYPTWRNDQIHPSGPGEVNDYARTSFSHGSQISGERHRDGGSLYDNDAEEEMIRAAIEASKKDVQDVHGNRRNTLSTDPSNIFSSDEVIKREDEDLARAISLSLETEELESAMREQIAEFQPHHMEGFDPHKSGTNEISRFKEPGSSSVQHGLEDIKQKQPIDNSSHHEHHLQHVESYPDPEEWGGIPSKELHEAIMLEKALFDGIANDTSHRNSLGHLTEGLSSNNMVSGEEPERFSAVKESLLPVEPSTDNEGAITLLIRMPDSNRHGRRFLRSDKFKCLFDFIDAGGAVKPGTYRVVRPYPRRAFSLDDGASTFEELGLTNKQEVLFLELI